MNTKFRIGILLDSQLPQNQTLLQLRTITGDMISSDNLLVYQICSKYEWPVIFSPQVPKTWKEKWKGRNKSAYAAKAL